jgi:uncharacterized protein YggT (Ycf19 family)
MKYLIGNVFSFLIVAYIILLTLRVILSWISLPPSTITLWLCKLTDPVLDFFRKKFPIRFGIFDLSIIIPITILLVLYKLNNDFLMPTSYEFKVLLNAWYLIGLILFITDLVLGFILTLYILITILILFFKLFSSDSYNQVILSFYNLLNPMLNFIKRTLKFKFKGSETVSLIILLVILIIINIAKTDIKNWLDKPVNDQLKDSIELNIDKKLIRGPLKTQTSFTLYIIKNLHLTDISQIRIPLAATVSGKNSQLFEFFEMPINHIYKIQAEKFDTRQA